MSHGHALDAVLDYPLPRIRCLLAAVARSQAQRDATLLNLVALGVRGSSENIELLTTQLTTPAPHT